MRGWENIGTFSEVHDSTREITNAVKFTEMKLILKVAANDSTFAI